MMGPLRCENVSYRRYLKSPDGKYLTLFAVIFRRRHQPINELILYDSC